MTGIAPHIPTLETGRLALHAHRIEDFETCAGFAGNTAPTRLAERPGAARHTSASCPRATHIIVFRHPAPETQP